MGKIPKYLDKIPENLGKNGTQWFAEINKDLFCASHTKKVIMIFVGENL